MRPWKVFFGGCNVEIRGESQGDLSRLVQDLHGWWLESNPSHPPSNPRGHSPNVERRSRLSLSTLIDSVQKSPDRAWSFGETDRVGLGNIIRLLPSRSVHEEEERKVVRAVAEKRWISHASRTEQVAVDYFRGSTGEHVDEPTHGPWKMWARRDDLRAGRCRHDTRQIF